MADKLRKSRRIISLDEVNNVLVEGGYLRAKLRGLTDFDKLAGGLAWGILNSRFSIDAEFVENAVIKDKIKIAENICRALREMRCPHDLDPHQIQGLDLPKIALVLEWLMKRVAAAREEHAAAVREFTVMDYSRRFRCRIGPKVTRRSLESRASAPQRVMTATATSYANMTEHASTVLLEYGLKYQMKDSVLLLQNASEMEGDADMQRDLAKLQAEEDYEQAQLDKILASMSAHREKQKLSTNSIARVMESADSQKIQKLKDMYEQRRQELQAKLEQEQAQQNELERQREKLKAMTEEQSSLANLTVERQAELDTLLRANASSKKKAKKGADAIEAQIASVDEIEKMLLSDPARSEQYAKLLQLLADIDAVEAKTGKDATIQKKQMTEAKEQCVDMANRIATLSSEEGAERFEAELATLSGQLAGVQAELSRKDQEALSVMRGIDEFPTRLELEQFDQRIRELNEEVGWKFMSTRLTYDVNNTKAEVLKFLQNELQVVSDVGEAFDQCISEKSVSKKVQANRDNLKQQIDQVLTQLAASATRQNERLTTETSSLHSVQQGYTALEDKRKEYHSLVAAIKEQMAENASLRAQLAAEQPDEDEEEP